jgi:hypothetical protein
MEAHETPTPMKKSEGLLAN